MLRITLFNRFPRHLLLWPLLAALALTACQSRKPDDYRQAHSYSVGAEKVALLINFTAPGARLGVSDERRLKRFLRDYVARGRGPMLVETSAGGNERARAAQVRAFLISRGLHANEISLKPGVGGGGDETAVILAFVANEVTVPACGDWSTALTANWENKIQADFGCATRRNVGLMIDDPGDLIEAKPLDGRDATRSDAVSGAYRAGESGASAKPGGQPLGEE